MKHTIKMLKTTLGCDDGVVMPTTFFEDQEYTIGESLMACFVDMGVVELVKANKEPAEDRDTKVTGPAETKVEAPAEPKPRKGKK